MYVNANKRQFALQGETVGDSGQSNGGKLQRQHWWATMQLLPYDNTEGKRCLKFINNDVIIHHDISL